MRQERDRKMKIQLMWGGSGKWVASVKEPGEKRVRLGSGHVPRSANADDATRVALAQLRRQLCEGAADPLQSLGGGHLEEVEVPWLTEAHVEAKRDAKRQKDLLAMQKRWHGAHKDVCHTPPLDFMGKPDRFSWEWKLSNGACSVCGEQAPNE